MNTEHTKRFICFAICSKEEFGEFHRYYEEGLWCYFLDGHKTEKHVGERTIPLAVEEQGILEKYLASKPAASYVFSKTSKRGYGKPFTAEEFGRYVKRAIDKHGLPKFVPYQVRHTYLTQTSFRHGRDTAMAVAGHTTEAMTARYDHSDFEKAVEVVRQRNREFLAKQAVGSDYRPAGLPALKIFNGE